MYRKRGVETGHSNLIANDGTGCTLQIVQILFYVGNGCDVTQSVVVGTNSTCTREAYIPLRATRTAHSTVKLR